jgi:hypothetical protein
MQLLANMAREENSVTDFHSYKDRLVEKKEESSETFWHRRFVRLASGSAITSLSSLHKDEEKDANLISNYVKEKCHGASRDNQSQTFSENIQDVLLKMSSAFGSEINEAFKNSSLAQSSDDIPKEGATDVERQIRKIDENMKAIDEDMKLLDQAKEHGEVLSAEFLLNGFRALGEDDYLSEDSSLSETTNVESFAGDASTNEDSSCTDSNGPDNEDANSDESSIDSNFMDEIMDEFGFTFTDIPDIEPSTSAKAIQKSCNLNGSNCKQSNQTAVTGSKKAQIQSSEGKSPPVVSKEISAPQGHSFVSGFNMGPFDRSGRPNARSTTVGEHTQSSKASISSSSVHSVISGSLQSISGHEPGVKRNYCEQNIASSFHSSNGRRSAKSLPRREQLLSSTLHASNSTRKSQEFIIFRRNSGSQIETVAQVEKPVPLFASRFRTTFAEQRRKLGNRIKTDDTVRDRPFHSPGQSTQVADKGTENPKQSDLFSSLGFRGRSSRKVENTEPPSLKVVLCETSNSTVSTTVTSGRETPKGVTGKNSDLPRPDLNQTDRNLLVEWGDATSDVESDVSSVNNAKSTLTNQLESPFLHGRATSPEVRKKPRPLSPRYRNNRKLCMILQEYEGESGSLFRDAFKEVNPTDQDDSKPSASNDEHDGLYRPTTESERESTTFPRIEWANKKRLKLRRRKSEQDSLDSRQKRKIRQGHLKRKMKEEKAFVQGLCFLNKESGKSIAGAMASQIR